MTPVEEKHTNDATSHILLFQRCNGAGSRREKLLLSQRNVVCSRLHIYQKKRPYLYSDNSGYTRELSAPCGVEQDISIDGKWESIERTCSTAEGEWIGSTMFSIMLPVWGCRGCCPLWLSIECLSLNKYCYSCHIWHQLQKKTIPYCLPILIWRT